VPYAQVNALAFFIKPKVKLLKIPKEIAEMDYK